MLIGCRNPQGENKTRTILFKVVHYILNRSVKDPLPPTIPLILPGNTRELKQRGRRRQRERQKRKRLILAKQQLCTYITLFVHLFAVTARLRRENT